MTEAGHTRLLPIRDRRALLERHEELAAEAANIDAEQQRLAVEFTRLRQELVDLRELLWPSADGRAFDKARRPPIAGPVPIPPALTDAMPRRGCCCAPNVRSYSRRSTVRSTWEGTSCWRPIPSSSSVTRWATKSDAARFGGSLGERT